LKVAVIYESRTGNTARVANMIAAAAEELGAEVGVWPSGRANLDFLSDADLVFLGTWTDGVIIAGHRPGDSRRLKALPGIWGRPTAGFVTYAIHAGKVLDKLERVVRDRGGEWIGGRLFKRGRLSDGVGAFVTAAFDRVGADTQA
jgi:hypothetical protein